MTRIEPGLAGAVVRPSNELYKDEDGRLRRGVHLTVTPEQFEQYRQGYRCLVCHSVQSTAFPDVCEAVWKDGGGCGFRIREEQMRRLELEFRGEESLWPRERHDALLEEEERALWTPRPGIWVPGSD